MAGEFEGGVIFGGIVTFILTLILLSFYWYGGGNRHDISWDDNVCMKLQVGTGTHNDPIYFQQYCAAAPELADWLRNRSK